MKYIISENKINKILDSMFISRYGNELIMITNDDDGYVFFFDEEGGKPFELNQGGTLWVNDYPFLKQLKRLFGLKESDEIDNFFRNYFLEKYGVNVKIVGSEGGYSKEGDSDDDVPWLDNEY